MDVMDSDKMMQNNSNKHVSFFVCALCACLFALGGCDADGGDAGGTGTVQVFVEPEETIPGGLTPGDGEENIVDGWTVTYDKFLIVFGNFRASRSSGGDTLSAPDVWVLDMKALPAGGLVVATFGDAAATRWDQVGYDLPNATAAAQCAEGISAQDCEMMKSQNYSLYIEGTITKADGQSCSPTDPSDCQAATEVRFAWGLKAGTAFDGCAGADEQLAGFAVPTGGTVQVKPTIHGDHWFFTNITQGAELTDRRAQWIANCDLNRDGETTLDELAQTQAADVFPSAQYNLSGALITVQTAKDYLEAQARTLGDFQGEGECPERKVLQ